MSVVAILCRSCNKEMGDTPFCPWCGARQQKPDRKPKKRGNGQGSVFKEGTTWTAVITTGYEIVDGKVRQKRKKKRGLPTKTAALEYLATLREQAKQGYVFVNNIQLTEEDVKLKTMWEGYQTTKMYNKLGKDSKSAYRTAWKKLEPLHERDIRTLTVEEMQEVIDNKAPTYEPAKDMQNVLSHCYKWAIIKQLVPVNLARMLTMPENEPQETIPFNSDEVDRLWGAYGDGDMVAALALLMIYSGMMPGELLIAEKSMIDWDKQIITGAGLKTHYRRKNPIVIADFMLPVLKDICDYSDSKYISFLRKSTFYKEFREMLARTNCRPELTPYSCRHSTATALALAGVHESIMMKVMRQKKIDTTRRYYHIDLQHSLEAVNALKKEEQ